MMVNNSTSHLRSPRAPHSHPSCPGTAGPWLLGRSKTGPRPEPPPPKCPRPRGAGHVLGSTSSVGARGAQPCASPRLGGRGRRAAAAGRALTQKHGPSGLAWVWGSTTRHHDAPCIWAPARGGAWFARACVTRRPPGPCAGPCPPRQRGCVRSHRPLWPLVISWGGGRGELLASWGHAPRPTTARRQPREIPSSATTQTAGRTGSCVA